MPSRHHAAAAFDEPACAVNRAKDTTKRKAGCSKALTPGAAAGGCAFDGAMIALQPIVDVAHLVHGPAACCGNSWDNRSSASSGSDRYRRGFTTDLGELDIVMGRGEQKLFRAIGELVAKEAPPAVFVYTTCVPALIGDDVHAVCKAAAERFTTPVVPIDAAGFVGSKNLGNRLGGEALFEHVIGTLEPEEVRPTDVNLIGDFNLSGELWQITPLLDRLGIRVLGAITGDARYRQVAMAHRANATMLVCSKALVSLARKLEERFGIPWFDGSFYGIGPTSAAIRTLCRLLVERGAPADLVARADALVAAEEAKTWAAIQPYLADLRGKRVLVYTGGHKSWSLVTVLQELGMTVVGTSMRKATDSDRVRVTEAMGHGEAMYENIAPKEMCRRLKSGEADLLMSGGRSQFVALKAKVPWVDVNQEKHGAQAGYAGMVGLVRTIHQSLTNPVWDDVRRPAPWELAPPAAQPVPFVRPVSDRADFEDC
ncbi:MAG: nitrogenase iron-molybdenum cofactor biosynthesis protein NifE [Geminicoccaceae bacterium]|nr:MAG: nitrogenase iron-molybdenum cofactor biosynthesis protein NifE [Geminicoccaceae bacterium]